MSNVIQFRPATREQVYFKGCLYGIGGSGKTLTGLLLLAGLVGPTGRIAVIDTERGRANKYLGRYRSPALPDGIQFDSFRPTSYDPASLTEAVAIAQAAGYDGLFVDSGSHYWDGPDGMTEQVDKHTAAARSSSSFNSGWKVMTPVEQRMWSALTGAELHVVMTLRVKSDYVMEEKQRGDRTTAIPKKVGLKPRQRDGFEYEFDVVMSLDETHTATVVKSDLDLVCPVGAEYEKPGIELGQTVLDFCREGEAAPGPVRCRAEALDPAATLEELKDLLGRVETAGITNAVVLDEQDQAVTLKELILARARAIRAADDAAARRTAPPSRTPAPASAASTTPARRASGRSTAKVPADVAKAAATGVDSLIGAADVATAAKLAGYAKDSVARDEPINGLLAGDDHETLRENLGLTDEPVTLAGFGARIAAYWTKHSRSPAVPVDADPDADQAPAAADEEAVA